MKFVIRNGYQKDVDDLKGMSRWEYWCDVVNHEFVNLDCSAIPGQDKSDFSGTLRGGLGVGQVNFSEVVAMPQFVQRSRQRIARATKDDFLISFQLERECVVRQSGREALLKPGSFALYDSASEYSLAFARPFHQFVLQMPRDVLSRHLMEPEKYTAIPISANEGMGLILKNFLYSLVGELSATDEPINDQLSDNLVNMIALTFSSTVITSKLIETDCVKEALMRRLRQFIDNNLFDPRLNNARIAESQNISVRYLYKLFSGEAESVHEMIMRKRLEASRAILMDEHTRRPSIESLAHHVGFASAAHFSRAFKKRFGASPSDVSPQA
ncbi:MAG: helix-turn-helix domain-containing protein [Lysobacterales bacterium]